MKLKVAKIYYGPQAYDLHGLPETLDVEEVVRQLHKSVPNFDPETVEVRESEANEFVPAQFALAAMNGAVQVLYA